MMNGVFLFFVPFAPSERASERTRAHDHSSRWMDGSEEFATEKRAQANSKINKSNSLQPIRGVFNVIEKRSGLDCN